MVADFNNFVISLLCRERRKRNNENMPDFRYFAWGEDTTTRNMPGEITNFNRRRVENDIIEVFVSGGRNNSCPRPLFVSLYLRLTQSRNNAISLSVAVSSSKVI